MNPVDVDPWAPSVPTCLPNVPLSRRVLALAPDRGFTDTLAFALARSVSHRRVERPPHAAAYVLRFADSSGLWFCYPQMVEVLPGAFVIYGARSLPAPAGMAAYSERVGWIRNAGHARIEEREYPGTVAFVINEDQTR